MMKTSEMGRRHLPASYSLGKRLIGKKVYWEEISSGKAD